MSDYRDGLTYARQLAACCPSSRRVPGTSCLSLSHSSGVISPSASLMPAGVERPATWPVRMFQARPHSAWLESILEFSRTEAETAALLDDPSLLYKSVLQTCFKCLCHAATRTGRSAPGREPAGPPGLHQGRSARAPVAGPAPVRTPRAARSAEPEPSLRMAPGIGIAASHPDGPSAE